MKIQSFEEFLQDKFTDLEPQVLDDDLPDAFDGWISNLDGEEYIKYAQQYGEKNFLDGMDKVLNGFKPYVENLRDIINTEPFKSNDN